MKYLVLMSLLLSCASSTYTIKKNELVPYKESSHVSKVLGKTKTIRIIELVDKREVLQLGEAFTGVEYQKTPVSLDEDFNLFLKKYFKESLEIRDIVETDMADLELQIVVHEVWVKEVIERFQAERAMCRVSMSFHLKGPREKWSGNFWTEFTSAGDLSDGSERLAPTLASCLNDIVEKLVRDEKFKNLLKY